MDSKQNNVIVLAGAGLLLLILIIFALMGAQSDPRSVADSNQIDLSVIPEVTADDNTRGAANAAVQLIEYSDIECPYCQEYHTDLLDLVERDPLANFSWTYRHFPLTQIHPDAFRYATATECAADQDGFWDYLDALVNRVRNDEDLTDSDLATLAANQGLNQSSFAACLDSDESGLAVNEDATQAQNSGATGTPFSVFEFDRSITDSEVEDIQGLFGSSTQIIVADGNRRIAIGGAIGATQIREMVNLIADPAQDQAVDPVSEGTEE